MSSDATLPRGVVDIDHALAEIERGLELLLNITPTNAAEAWQDFEKGGFAKPPMLQSRPLDADLDLVRRELYELELEKIDDPALSELLCDKRDEIGRQITLLQDRDSSRFLYASLALFGEPGEALVKEAEELLSVIPRDVEPDGRVTADGFAKAAQRELDLYTRSYEGFAQTLEVRSDVSDLMVSHGKLMIPSTAVFRAGRVDPLIQHEVGTHVVTYANGAAQPLKLLAVGLPGYEETQEGLAVLAEHAVNGLDPQRLRLLAARVVAVHRVIEGAGFLEVFEELHEHHGFPPRAAWAVTIRVTRSGGLTKDVIYLRGIKRVLEFAERRRDLTALLVGKLSLDHVALVEELMERGMLSAPWITPRWLEADGAADRLAHVYEGMRVIDLLSEVPT